MRGDRPATILIRLTRTVASPHARGSTRFRGYCAGHYSGFPACAGIDPITTDEPAYPVRLPRMRGDRPTSVGKYPTRRKASPHARGSTLGRSRGARGDVGFPACAGIDPPKSGSRNGGRRLPRMRGDRPIKNTASPPFPPASPHARGSTQGVSMAQKTKTGFPACAGIDLTSPSSSRTRTWLPRMRGDRPRVVPSQEKTPLASPHARGST